MIGETERLAIQAWVVASSGLPPEKVRWKRSGNARAAMASGCWVSLQVVEERENGVGYQAGNTPASSPAPGADLDFKRIQPMVGILQIDCFLSNADWDTERPDQRVAAVLRARNNPERSVLLRAAGVGFGATLPTVTNDESRDGVADVMVRGRIALNYNDASHELGTWIERMDIEGAVSIDGVTAIETVVEDSVYLPAPDSLPLEL